MKIPFELQANEAVVDCWPGARIKSALSIQTGRVWLTSQRLIFQPTVMVAFWVMPLVGLVMWYLQKKEWLYQPLATIEGTERTSFGRNKNVMKLATRAGELKILVDQYDAFATAFDNQRKAAA